MKRIILILFLSLLTASSVHAQKFSASTNLVGYLNFATLSFEGSYAVKQHWSVSAGVKYNPFSFTQDSQTLQNKQRTFYAGFRYWPWHTYAGWWVCGKMQWQEYNAGGIISQKGEQGEKYGAGFTAGYTLMLSSRLNMDFGLGLWGGLKKYSQYACPICGIKVNSGIGGFLTANDVLIALTYVF